MLAFPQLSSGAIAQLPNVRGQQYRTRIAETAGGVVHRMGDERARSTVWTFPFTGLTPDERAAIDGLFTATEGRLRTFTFLDPNDNLLAHSSSPAEGVWEKQTGLILVAGQSDPFGGTTAVRVTNPTGVALRLYQEPGVPGHYLYCLSAYVQAVAGVRPRLLMGPATDLRFAELGGNGLWQRHWLVHASSETAEAVMAGVELPAASEIVLSGMQMEAGTGMSGYKATGTRSGVYQRCRFAMDELRWTTEGPGEHSVELSVVTVG